MRLFPIYSYRVKITHINVIYENFWKAILVTEVNHEI
jgi:hypothetical protein